MRSEQFPFPSVEANEQPQDGTAAEASETPKDAYGERGRYALDSYGSSPETTGKPDLFSKNAKDVIKKLTVIGVSLYAALTLSACGADKNAAAAEQPSPAPEPAQVDVAVPQWEPGRAESNSLTGSPELDAILDIDGSFNQYDNYGGHDVSYAKNPALREQGRPDIYSPGSFSNVADLLTLMSKHDLIADPANITPEEWGTAFKAVVFSEKELAAYVAVSNNVSGFEGLSYKEATAKIAAMDSTGKQELQAALQDVFSRAAFSDGSVTGSITNYYIPDDAEGGKRIEAQQDYIEYETGTIVMRVSGESAAHDDGTYIMTPDGRYMPAAAYATETSDDDGVTYVTEFLKRCFNPAEEGKIIDNATGVSGRIIINTEEPSVIEEPGTTSTETGKPAGGDSNIGGRPAGGDPGIETSPEVPSDNSPEVPPDTSPEVPPETSPGVPPETPPETSPENPPETPTAQITPKDETSQRDNAAADVTQAPVSDSVTSPEAGQENVEQITWQEEQTRREQEEARHRAEEQAAAEAQAAEEAESRRRAEEQAEAERAAAAAQADAEAESRRQADEAAARAEAEAEARQQAAAEAERQRAAEEAARQTAQEEANQQAATESADVNATMDERGNMFDNGAF